MANKIDSNVTGLRYAEETSLKVLPGSPVWYPLEPNKYNDFGSKISTVSRKPISQSRQLQKGTVTDLDASGGFEQDLTQNNTYRLLQGFFFADAREMPQTHKLNVASVPTTAVSATLYTTAFGASLAVGGGDIIFAEGFGVAGNNGMKVTTAAAGTTITAPGLATESSPPTTASITLVGKQFPSGDITIAMVAGLPRLTSATINFTTLWGSMLIPGMWVFVGGDTTATRLTGDLTGFARINAVAATYLEFDKTDWTAVVDAGTGKTVQVFFGNTLKNESTAALIKRRTYQLERQLGNDADGIMSEYLVGAVANDFTINVKQADKITIDMNFVAVDNEQRTGLQAPKAGGTRPTMTTKSAFNTSSDFSRIKLALVDITTPVPTALFAFATDLTVKIANNVSPNKAIGTLGAFDTTAGLFEVTGKLTAYFSSISAVAAVRNSSDVTLDMAIVKNNAGFVLDLPLLTLGDGSLKVEMDKPIDLPLDLSASASKFDHTFLVAVFPYLPTIAG